MSNKKEKSDIMEAFSDSYSYIQVIAFIIWVFWTIASLVFYHKIFTVYYFSLFHGFLSELILAAIIGSIMFAATVFFWYIADIIILIIGIISAVKLSRKYPVVLAVILIIPTTAIGVWYMYAMNLAKSMGYVS